MKEEKEKEIPKGIAALRSHTHPHARSRLSDDGEEAVEDKVGMVEAARGDVGRHLETVSAGKAHPQTGILTLKGADVALYLETYAVQGSREHTVFGIRPHQRCGVWKLTGCLRGFALGAVKVVVEMVEIRSVEIDERQQGRIVVHRLQTKLCSGTDDTAFDTAMADEVVGDASAGIDDEETVTGDVVGSGMGHLFLKDDDSSEVVGKAVRAVALRGIVEHTGGVVAKPYVGPGLRLQGCRQRSIIVSHATHCAGFDGIDAANAAEKTGPRFEVILTFDIDDFAFSTRFSRTSYGKFCTGISNVNEEFHFQGELSVAVHTHGHPVL